MMSYSMSHMHKIRQRHNSKECNVISCHESLQRRKLVTLKMFKKKTITNFSELNCICRSSNHHERSNRHPSDTAKSIIFLKETPVCC